MVITIDTSALLAVLLNEKHKQKIINLTKGNDLLAPLSLDAEVGNALSAMFRRGRLSLSQAREVLTQFENIPVRRTNLRLAEATEIAYKHSVYAYDAYVLDCAMHYRTPLLSLDDQLKAIGYKLDVNILEVSP